MYNFNLLIIFRNKIFNIIALIDELTSGKCSCVNQHHMIKEKYEKYYGYYQTVKVILNKTSFILFIIIFCIFVYI